MDVEGEGIPHLSSIRVNGMSRTSRDDRVSRLVSIIKLLSANRCGLEKAELARLVSEDTGMEVTPRQIFLECRSLESCGYVYSKYIPGAQGRYRIRHYRWIGPLKHKSGPS